MARKSRMNLTISAHGIRDVIEQLGSDAARELWDELDKDVERNAIKIANQAAENAPVKTGKLAGSIPPSVKRVRKAKFIFGSDVPYATRQEYEHDTKKAFFRRALWAGRVPLRDDIKRTIKRKLGG